MTKSTPGHAAIAAILRNRIKDGTYKPGTRLPAQQKFRTEFGCSITPVVNAYYRLIAEGLIRRRMDAQSAAYFVTTEEERKARKEAAQNPARLAAGAGPDTEWMTPHEVGKLFGVAPNTVSRWHHEGILKEVIRLPGENQRRYGRSEVMALYGGSSKGL